MAPTIQTQAREGGHRSSSHRTIPERSGVVCRVKYCNSLPDIPFDPKFITYPFDQHRFVQYKATSLEKQHRHELLTEPDLGVTIDLINPDTYRIDPNIILDPADEKLLEEDIQAPSSSKRSQQHAKVVPWMRKTEYISTEFNRYGVSNEKVEVKIGVSVKQQFTEEEIYKDRDSQIAAIEKTFEDAQKPVTQHYSKPRVTPVEVMPVFPDFKMWINPCAQVIFDSDPAPKDVAGPTGVDMMSQAMIRGMMDEEGNQFVAYFLPHEETMGKRKRDVEEEIDYMPEEVYDYKIAREYNWNVKNKASKGYEENYFFIFRDGDGVYYNELETRVRLSKRRAKAGAQSTSNAVLVVKHRDMNEKELEAQEARKAQLENHEPEDEEEEMDLDKDNRDPGDKKEKGSEAEHSDSDSEQDDDEEPGGERKKEKGDGKRGQRRRSPKGSDSESGDDQQERLARDEEEIFGSDDDDSDNGDSDNEAGVRRNESSHEEGSGSEEEEGGRRSRSRSRSRSATPAHSSSDHSEAEQNSGSGSGSEQGSDSSSDSD
ncbi:RNA polymerase II-associated factor 1 homolog [Acipenser ruthenus]|uniref:RNA polymerase II-associated factor 1 homolog n=1 Tax=Acipenser ruthenus TaxID=7906 RepID=UPI00145BC3CD|nr:RNA polymerase II-associated factor 1 homolog [Acipenser ruthenus]XP_058882653.1 RNA polymerase II-associated factor 1 homolog [Acipenser ruthenus]